MPSRIPLSLTKIFTNEGSDKRLPYGTIASKHGRFFSFWALDLIKWHDHVRRARGPNTWCVQLLDYKKRGFIDNCRNYFSAFGESRTCTRSRIGGVSIRWETGYDAAKCFMVENPQLRISAACVEGTPVTEIALIERLQSVFGL